MRHIALIFTLALAIIHDINAQEPIDYFLPQDLEYDQNIPTPEKYFRQQLGEWHLTHDQVLNYMNEIAAVSNRAVISEYARTYENRPLIHIIFTTPENHARLEELKELHIKFSNPDEDLPHENTPLVISLNYGVHGNESSATNSSVLTAYYLAAAKGPQIDKLLKNSIILVDPCLNPDGFSRHSTWSNMHQSATEMTSSDSRQYQEVWPGCRTNHYWFDLNRDYLPLVHPESKGRVARFHEWKPNIYTDHHEMGPDNTFFFQPGAPTRYNPLTPPENKRLTKEIAEYHSRFLDRIGSLYFCEEQYDDYYVGKGSSYPDIHGSVGILFEQAGFRGRIRETVNGIKKLSFGIKNQFTVTLSTLEAAMDLKDDLLLFQKHFYREALQKAKDDPVKAYFFGDAHDPGKNAMFVELLNRHQIKIYENEKEFEAEGIIFKPGSSYAVPVNQTQYTLIKSLFEEITTFSDSTFYDVSTWTFPYAFNMPFIKSASLKNHQISAEPAVPVYPEGKVTGGKSDIAYLLRWSQHAAPEALYRIQNAGLITKTATKEFSFNINNKNESFSYGTVMIPVSGQKSDTETIYQLVTKVASATGAQFFGLKTGLSDRGIDTGSGSFIPLQKPEVLMLAGRGASSTEAGEIWHMFDQRFHIPVCLTEIVNLASVDINRYNTIIMPGGSYPDLSKKEAEKIKRWVENGGTLIAVKDAAIWTTANSIGSTKYKKGAEPDSLIQTNYENRNKVNSLNAIGGAIFRAEMDISHPLCYGYTKEDIAIFKTGVRVAEPSNNKHGEPVKYTEDPYLSGFVSKGNLERIKSAPVVSVQSFGRGKLITLHESMTFRGFWLGTNKIFMNSVFFGKTVR
jgi:hypothetical protein